MDMDAQELRNLAHQAQIRPTPGQIYTRLQADRAASGQAAGQCGECGAFRADGQPPILHRDGCSADTHSDRVDEA